MRKFFALFIAVCIAALPLYAKDKNKDTSTAIPEYQITGVSRAQGSGGVIVKISIVGKKADKVTQDMLGRAAVHGVLFRGYGADGQAGVSNHPPMMGTPTAETQYSEFFKPFFDNGTYSGYIQMLDDSRRVVKVGKEYKVSCNVIVSEGVLRSDLTKAGLIKGLDQGW